MGKLSCFQRSPNNEAKRFQGLGIGAFPRPACYLFLCYSGRSGSPSGLAGLDEAPLVQSLGLKPQLALPEMTQPLTWTQLQPPPCPDFKQPVSQDQAKITEFPVFLRKILLLTGDSAARNSAKCKCKHFQAAASCFLSPRLRFAKLHDTQTELVHVRQEHIFPCGFSQDSGLQPPGTLRS